MYFQASGRTDYSNAIPELKRVIVAYKDSIVMEQTLEDSLTRLFGQQTAAQETAAQETAAQETAAEPAAQTAEPASLTPAQQALIESALEAYTQGQQALQSGDWEAYGDAQTRLGLLLEQLTQTEQ